MRAVETLVVAPMAEEAAGLLERLRETETVGTGRAALRVGRLSKAVVGVAATGDGAANAAAGLSRLLAECTPRRLLVVGAAGGLTPNLAVGDVVAGRRIRTASGAAPPPDREWLDSWGGAGREGTVFTADRIAVTPEEKAGFLALLRDSTDGAPGAGEPATVDVESASYAAVAAEAGVPFLVLRCVSDAWDEELPLDFNRFRDGSGSIDRSKIVRHVAFRPTVAAALLRLKSRVELCTRRLAEAAAAAVAAG